MDEAARDGRFGSSEAGKKGGKARAKMLSSAERADIARAGAEARWAKAGHKTPLRAICGAEDRPLKLGDVEIPCYVLEDETRVLAFRGLQEALGGHKSGSGGAPRLASTLERIGVKGAAHNDLAARLNTPIRFHLPRGGPPGHGLEVTVLADICEAVLSARKAGELPARLAPLADRCEVLVRGFAKLGLIALVDEVTGYQEFRARNALSKILEAFIAKDLQKWVSTFRSDYYTELFRLWAIPFDPAKPTLKRPQYVGTLTNNIIYSRLAPGVLVELRARNPINESGGRPAKHHQHLTRDIGHPKLKEHLAAVVALMRVCKTKEEFLKMLDRALPKYQEMPLFEQKETKALPPSA